jgi:2-polyprenyl-3-methyl-5-hydroxy-6-metoxy-1,4-benzoquinol methylase
MDLLNYYDSYSEEGRLTRYRSRKIEYLSTVKAIENVLSPNHKTIELGSGVGIYAEILSQKCNSYYATDIVPKHVAEMERKFNKSNNIYVDLIDATNIPEKYKNNFDVVLCLGPYYHLPDNVLRKKCIDQCIKIAKPNSIIAFSYINKLFINLAYLKNNITFSDTEYDFLLTSSNSRITNKDDFFAVSYFCTPEEIEIELNDSGLTIIDHLRTDGAYRLLDQQLENISDKDFDSLVNFHYLTCRNKDALSMSLHGLIICKSK